MLDWYVKQFAKLGVQLEVRATDYNRFQDKMQQGLGPDLLAGAGSPTTRTPRTSCSCCTGPNAKALTDGNGENNDELPEPGVRQALRADEVPRRRAGEAEADRPDDRDRAARRGRGASATSRRRRPPTTSGSPTASRRRSSATTSATCGSIPSCARARSPNGTDRSGGRSPLIALALGRGARAGVVRVAPTRARECGAHARPAKVAGAVIDYILRRAAATAC